MTTKTMDVGLLKKFLDNFFDNIQVAVKVPGGQVYAITSAQMKSVGAETPLVFELLTEKDLDARQIQPVLIGNGQRDNFQP